jgi:hypothetical protein
LPEADLDQAVETLSRAWVTLDQRRSAPPRRDHAVVL